MMTKNTRLFTILFVAIIVVMMLFSSIYMAVEAEHDCDGEHCVICHQLDMCANTLRNLSIALGVVAIAAVISFSLTIAFSRNSEPHINCTLVSLKVKLSV